MMIDKLKSIAAKIVDPLAISPAFIFPIISITLGYKTNYSGRVNGWGGRISLLKSETDSLFCNGIFHCRIMLPFFISLQFRWAGSNPQKCEYLQTYIGWKLNGQFSVVLRVQSDESAANGYTSKNYGQAIGWADGAK